MQLYGTTLSLEIRGASVCRYSTALPARVPECTHASTVAQHRHSHRRCGYSSIGLLIVAVVGRLKGGRTDVKDRTSTPVPVRRGMGNLGHAHLRRISSSGRLTVQLCTRTTDMGLFTGTGVLRGEELGVANTLANST